MNDFDYDVMQRKRLARQAFHRKCGSKSKKCSLSTDRMTQKQWKERCGEVMTCQLGKPMSWRDFKAMSAGLRRAYILDMIQRYSVTASDLARMFGVSSRTVYAHCSSPEVDVHFRRGRPMPKDRREEFEKLLSGELSVEIPVEVPQETPQEASGDAEDHANADASSASYPGLLSDTMTMTDFSLCFQGEINLDSVMNSLRAIMPHGKPAALEIKCYMLSA